MTRVNELITACIEACNACASACDHCAVACLREPDPKAMSRCIGFDLDCADLCRLASTLMSRGSDHARDVCRVCATVCEACGDECAKHPMAHCQRCAEACRRCVHACMAVAV